MSGKAMWIAAVIAMGFAAAAPAATPPAKSAATPNQSVVVGSVQRFVKDGQGRIERLLMSGGQEVLIPPEQGLQVERLGVLGKQVRVEGQRLPAQGKTQRLRAERIENLATGKQLRLNPSTGTGGSGFTPEQRYGRHGGLQTAPPASGTHVVPPPPGPVTPHAQPSGVAPQTSQPPPPPHSTRPPQPAK